MRCFHSIVALLAVTSFASIIPLHGAGLCSDGRARVYDRFYKKTYMLRSRDGQYPQGVFMFNSKPGLIRSNGVCHDLVSQMDTNEVRAPALITIQDIIGNRMYTNDMGQLMVHVSLHHKAYRVAENINNARFAISRDRRNMFAFDSRNGSSVYMFNTQKPNVCPQDTISLVKIADLGTGVYSLAIDNITGNIITAVKNHTTPGEWSVQVYTKLDSNPCQGAVLSDQKFRDSTQAAMEVIMAKYKIDTASNTVMCNKANKNKMTKVKCDNLEAFQTLLHAKLSEINVLHGTLMTDVREYYKNGDNINPNDPSINKCEPINYDEIFDIPQQEPQPQSPSPQPQLQPQAQENNDNLQILNRDLQTLIDGADLIGPFFNTSIFDGSVFGNEIEEFSRRNYVCVDKTKVKRWQESSTAAGEQYQYLLNGLGILRGNLSPSNEETEPADVAAAVQISPPVDNPDNILSSIDVRFSLYR